MSDINPQWRYKAMTELFGPCGVGWMFTIDKVESSKTDDGQVVVSAKISLFVWQDTGWSEAIPGMGGSKLVAKESSGNYVNDEAHKMAVTDALGTAMKMLGVAADVYAGLWDGSKYREAPAENTSRPPPKSDTPPPMTDKQKKYLNDLMKKQGLSEDERKEFFGWHLKRRNRTEPDVAWAKDFISNFDDNYGMWNAERIES